MSAANVKGAGVPVLSGAAVRHLRALGHPLAPVVRVGKEGITASLVEATKTALLRHELVKVKVQGEAPIERREAARTLADATSAVLAQVLGRTFLLYRRHPKTPRIVLPRAGKAGVSAHARVKPVTEARAPSAAHRDDDEDEDGPSSS